MEYVKTFFSYIFEPSPGQPFNYYTLLFIAIALLIAGSFAIKSIYKKRVSNRDFVFKKMFKKVSGRMIYFAMGLLFLVVIRYENIPYFAMRFWLYMLILGILAYAGYQLYKYFKIYPKELSNFESNRTMQAVEDSRKRYLPNKNKR